MKLKSTGGIWIGKCEKCHTELRYSKNQEPGQIKCPTCGHVNVNEAGGFIPKKPDGKVKMLEGGVKCPWCRTDMRFSHSRPKIVTCSVCRKNMKVED